MIPLKDNSILEIHVRKDPTEAWVSFDNLLVYTVEEQDNVFTPYLNFVRALPGFISLTNQREPDDSNVTYKEILFDTAEHAMSAARQLYGEGRNSLVKARDDLVKSKLSNPAAFERTVFVCKEPFSKTIAVGRVLPGIG